MKKPQIKDKFHAWIYANSWVMVVALIGAILFVARLGFQVEVNAQKIKEVEEVVEQYPSERWFELKFKGIEKELQELRNEIKE